MSLLVNIASTTSLSPFTTLRSPSGNPASENNSANLIDIILDLEDEFDIEIDDESMENMLSVKSAIDIIENKLAES